jgi:hypothetical protein
MPAVKLVVVVLAVWLVASPPGAWAQEADCEARLARAQAALERDARHGRLYTWGWGLGYGAVTLGGVGLALYLDDEGESVEQWVGAGKSFLGLATVLLQPVPARRDAPALRARLAEPGVGRCRLAEEAEAMVRGNARDQRFARSWLAHAGTVAVNAGGLLIVGLGYDRWLTGSLAAALGIVVGEAQIWTRPSASLQVGLVPVVGDTLGLSVIGRF